MSDYAHPEALVSTNWVADHSKDPKVKIVEVDVDTTSYDKGHLAGAIGWNWQTELQDRVQRNHDHAGGCHSQGRSPTPARSSAVRTATTPGIARAAVAPTARIRAWAWGERSILTRRASDVAIRSET